MPITMQEGADQQQESTLWLMEISNQHLHYLIGISWSYNNLCTGMQGFQSILIQIIYDSLNSLHRSNIIYKTTITTIIIRIPLIHMQILFIGLWMFQQMNTHIIKTFNRTNTGSTHSYHLTIMVK